MIQCFQSYELEGFYRALKTRKTRQSLDLMPSVWRIIESVVETGDAAVMEATEKFDGVTLDALRVTEEALESAFETSELSYISALDVAIENIRRFHAPQVQKGYELRDKDTYMGQKVGPISRVGIYVPGGAAVYPSTLLMNAIPAQLAGVNEIVVVTPPQKNLESLKAIYAAAYRLGIREVYQIGGVQAIAALAYGTESIKPVQKITGPGNQYVTLAKKLVFGDVAIDMIAGPSEVLIVSDGQTPIKYIAADLLAQLEHDREAMAVLLTTSEVEVEVLEAELIVQSKMLTRAEDILGALSQNVFVIRCASVAEMVCIANQVAPEHLEWLVSDNEDAMDGIVNAGALFIGSYTPEALGDYLAGPNHTLPTTGTAKFSSPLGVYDFQKRMNYLYYGREAFERAAAHVVKFAEKEGLDAHGKSISIRL